MAEDSHNCNHNLSNQEIDRYSRHLILDKFGPTSQTHLKSSSCLIIGLGGLGCPAAQHLAVSGIGKIGLVDYDKVELNNLHRQILHTEKTIGHTKVSSAAKAINSLNSLVTCICHDTLLNRDNAISIINNYDVIVDATDNVPTRYLINDVCILLNKPLISGSALRFEGQLTVYNYLGGPCYRCLFPSPPPPEAVTNCSDGGVLGVIPGIIGNLQALEAIKILSKLECSSLNEKLLIFDGLECSFREIKLRKKRPNCYACGDNSKLTSNLPNYEEFCRMSPNDRCMTLNILKPEDRITCETYNECHKNDENSILIDCRKKVEFEICHLSNSVNITLNEIQKCQNPIELIQNSLATCQNAKNVEIRNTQNSLATSQNVRNVEIQKTLNSLATSQNDKNVYFMCHKGNDSQIAVKILKDFISKSDEKHYSINSIKDIIGGIEQWALNIDKNFPLY